MVVETDAGISGVGEALARYGPKAYAELRRIYNLLERHYRDMQDLEFTVEQGKLWMLQTRNGKRTAKAALRIAVELANEGLISKKEAVTRVDPASLGVIPGATAANDEESTANELNSAPTLPPRPTSTTAPDGGVVPTLASGG